MLQLLVHGLVFPSGVQGGVAMQGYVVEEMPEQVMLLDKYAKLLYEAHMLTVQVKRLSQCSWCKYRARVFPYINHPHQSTTCSMIYSTCFPQSSGASTKKPNQETKESIGSAPLVVHTGASRVPTILRMKSCASVNTSSGCSDRCFLHYAIKSCRNTSKAA